MKIESSVKVLFIYIYIYTHTHIYQQGNIILRYCYPTHNFNVCQERETKHWDPHNLLLWKSLLFPWPCINLRSRCPKGKEKYKLLWALERYSTVVCIWNFRLQTQLLWTFLFSYSLYHLLSKYLLSRSSFRFFFFFLNLVSHNTKIRLDIIFTAQ